MPVGAPSHEPPSTKMGGEGRLEAGSRSKPCAAGPGGGAASQKGRPAGREAKRGGRSREQKRWDEGGDGGAASSLYPGQAARGRQPRSGEAKPEEAAHRNGFYIANTTSLIKTIVSQL
jgi:hypothetical protein